MANHQKTGAQARRGNATITAKDDGYTRVCQNCCERDLRPNQNSQGAEVRKELTREDVIRAIDGVLENTSSVYLPDFREQVADALGLVAPKPFEREAWVVVRGTVVFGRLYFTRDESEGACSPGDRVIRVRITEIPK